MTDVTAPGRLLPPLPGLPFGQARGSSVYMTSEFLAFCQAIYAYIQGGGGVAEDLTLIREEIAILEAEVAALESGGLAAALFQNPSQIPVLARGDLQGRFSSIDFTGNVGVEVRGGRATITIPFDAYDLFEADDGVYLDVGGGCILAWQ